MSKLPEPGQRVRLKNIKDSDGTVNRNLPVIKIGPHKGEIAPNLATMNGDNGFKWYITPDTWEYIGE